MIGVISTPCLLTQCLNEFAKLKSWPDSFLVTLSQLTANLQCHLLAPVGSSKRLPSAYYGNIRTRYSPPSVFQLSWAGRYATEVSSPLTTQATVRQQNTKTLGIYCPYSLSLTNQDVVQLSAALDLGPPCPNNTCRTTVSCFLASSIHSSGLWSFRIHFNTKNLADDIQSFSKDPNFRRLHSLPKRCPLKSFYARGLPFPPDTPAKDITIITTGFVDIFPSLISILGTVAGAGTYYIRGFANSGEYESLV